MEMTARQELTLDVVVTFRVDDSVLVENSIHGLTEGIITEITHEEIRIRTFEDDEFVFLHEEITKIRHAIGF